MGEGFDRCSQDAATLWNAVMWEAVLRLEIAIMSYGTAKGRADREGGITWSQPGAEMRQWQQGSWLGLQGQLALPNPGVMELMLLLYPSTFLVFLVLWLWSLWFLPAWSSCTWLWSQELFSLVSFVVVIKAKKEYCPNLLRDFDTILWNTSLEKSLQVKEYYCIFSL